MNDLRNLSRVEVPQVLGSFTGVDVQTTHGPLWYLTSGLCEDTGYWNQEVFQFHQVASGDGYPLTPAEIPFIQSDGVTISGYITDILTGYSIWWQNKKWFSPSLEYCYQPEKEEDQFHGRPRVNTPSFFDRPEALRVFVESEAERLQHIVSADGGSVLLDLESHPDRYCISLLFPCDLVIKRFEVQNWRRYLHNLFLFALPVKEPWLVYIDDCNIEQDRHHAPAISNRNGKLYGCSIYNLNTVAPFSEENDDAFREWFREQEAVEKVWAPSEGAAVHNARLQCYNYNWLPIDPVTCRYVPRSHYLNA
jgi:hypothetical protein